MSYSAAHQTRLRCTGVDRGCCKDQWAWRSRPAAPRVRTEPLPTRGRQQQQQRQQRKQPVQPCASTASPCEVLHSGANWSEELWDQLADRLLHRLASLPPDRKMLIGVAGIPGSGKSTLSREVVRRLNGRRGEGTAVNVPMDGFHLYKRQLDAMPDPSLAYARRGAPWTFDAQAYVDCIAAIRGEGAALAPSFDHGAGDPLPDAIAVTPAHRIVLSEGNYLLLPEEPWAQLRQLFDEVWFVDCGLEEAMQRVYRRQTGHGVAPEASRRRIAGNDRPNAELILTTRPRATLAVPALPLRSYSESGSESGCE